ncbi:MAG TPA: hypothetical protein VNO30_35195 [Kofleriaceae bacterium]|nr:hypothetical protein [Kofleriaceae bacterium]
MFVSALATLLLDGGVLISRVQVARAIAVRRVGQFGALLGSRCGVLVELQPKRAVVSLLCARGARGAHGGSGWRLVLALDTAVLGRRTFGGGGGGRRDGFRPRRRRSINQRSLSDRPSPLWLGKTNTTRQRGTIPLPHRHSDR